MNLEQLSAECTKIQLPHNLPAYDKEDVLVSRFVFARTPGGYPNPDPNPNPYP